MSLSAQGAQQGAYKQRNFDVSRVCRAFPLRRVCSGRLGSGWCCWVLGGSPVPAGVDAAGDVVCAGLRVRLVPGDGAVGGRRAAGDAGAFGVCRNETRSSSRLRRGRRRSAGSWRPCSPGPGALLRAFRERVARGRSGWAVGGERLRGSQDALDRAVIVLGAMRRTARWSPSTGCRTRPMKSPGSLRYWRSWAWRARVTVNASHTQREHAADPGGGRRRAPRLHGQAEPARVAGGVPGGAVEAGPCVLAFDGAGPRPGGHQNHRWCDLVRGRWVSRTGSTEFGP